MSESDETVRSNQEQAVAAWIDYLHQIRLNELVPRLNQQNQNLIQAVTSLRSAVETIDREVIGTNRGGDFGIHGYIAEVAEMGVGNARRLIIGEEAPYSWVNNNGPADLLRDGTAIQQKFYANTLRHGLPAVAEHSNRYPTFLTAGGKYQVPSSHLEEIRRLYHMPYEEAAKHLSRSRGGPSLTDWERVQQFFRETELSIDSLEASQLDYPEVQRGAYRETLRTEEESLQVEDEARRAEMYAKSRPSLKQGAQATAAAAGIEGGTAFILGVAQKRRGGTPLSEFTREDWEDVATDSAHGTFRGAVRGASIYSLSSFTATPAAVANALVTAGFAVAEQAHRLRSGDITEAEFIVNAEIAAMEAGVSALSSCLGQALIPVPVIGAVIGNTVGTILYKTASSNLSAREAAIIQQYAEEQHALDERLHAAHLQVLADLDAAMSDYLTLLDNAFHPDVDVALRGSVELAQDLGISPEEILNSAPKIDAYFLE